MQGAFDAWVGRTEQAIDHISLVQTRQLAAILDMDVPEQAIAGLADGGPLPPLWHWLAFLPAVPMSGLGSDGHPARGGFLPPVPLKRRMWAGGRLQFFAPVRIGAALERHSEILKVSEKSGGTGRMVFVTVRHQILCDGALAVSEEQDIVYVAMPDRFRPPAPVAAPETPDWQEDVAVDTVRLFRFSAVTFNAHRIHYDLDYAQRVEKYPGLVVHGPLQAILLMQAARRYRGGDWPAAFSFRGVRPAFHTDQLRLMGVGAALCTVQGDGLQCCQAKVSW